MPIQLNPLASAIVGYNRIEPRTRIQDFEISLSNPVHDAMWMLTQQWRIGEFRGSDGGSIVNAKLTTTSAKLNRFKAFDTTTTAYSLEELPLETIVERLPIRIDLFTRLQMGRHWLRLLRTVTLSEDYDAWFINEFPIAAATTPEELSNAATQSVRVAIGSNGLDGAALYEYVLTHAANDFAAVDASDWTAVNNVIAAFKTWYTSLYSQPEDTGVSWSASNLEYRFEVSAPDPPAPATTQTVLTGDEYNGSSIDWYSTDLHNDEEAELTESPADPTLNTTGVEDPPTVASYVPGPVTFIGMPKARWWQFEDRMHDIGKVVTRKNDVVRMLVTDFGLTYSNNWFVVPHTIEAGTLTAVNSLVTTDTFGRQTLINRAGSGEDDDWQKWNLFTLNRRGDEAVAADERLFIPPSLPQAPESRVLEKVVFLRDEMANMVWGVEELIDNDLGQSVSGKEAWNMLLDYFRAHPLEYPPMAEGTYQGNEATIAYRISNTVPENWIPFIPVNTGNINREIMLQRAAMLRKIDALRTGTSITPRTGILAQPGPYFINEEEITKTGLTVTSSFQRTRWYDGRILTWFGYSTQAGRGEGSSGLKFDYLDTKAVDTSDITEFVNQEDSARLRLEENDGYLIQ